MKLTLERTILTDKSTIGVLYVDDVRECFTLEDKVREVEGKDVSTWKIAGKTAIPKGTYRIIKDFSPKYKKEMLHILNVLGFSGVRIHSGNKAEDTEGCILIGTTVGRNMVLNSRIAMERLFQKVSTALEKEEEVILTIK